MGSASIEMCTPLLANADLICVSLCPAPCPCRPKRKCVELDGEQLADSVSTRIPPRLSSFSLSSHFSPHSPLLLLSSPAPPNVHALLHLPFIPVRSLIHHASSNQMSIPSQKPQTVIGALEVPSPYARYALFTAAQLAIPASRIEGA